MSFGDLRVDTTESGEVEIVCHSRPEPQAPLQLRVREQAARLSISHDGDYAVATVLAAPLHSDIEHDLGRRKAEVEQRSGL